MTVLVVMAEVAGVVGAAAGVTAAAFGGIALSRKSSGNRSSVRDSFLWKDVNSSSLSNMRYSSRAIQKTEYLLKIQRPIQILLRFQGRPFQLHIERTLRRPKILPEPLEPPGTPFESISESNTRCHFLDNDRS